MTAQPRAYISEEAYLQRERVSVIKHEYYAGNIYAMTGASENHNLIAMNLAALLHTQLRGRSCRAYPSDMRVKVVQTGLNTYPDFTIVCGQSEFTDPEKRDTLTNPVVIIEILSPSTERYDRGLKFQHYRTIETLKEYVLVAQDRYYIERFVCQEAGKWVLSEANSIDTSIPIDSIQGSLALRDVYENIIIAPDESSLHLAEE